MPFGIGWQELAIVLVIMMVIFGPKRLPELGRSLGKGLKEFKKSTTELQQTLTLDEPASAETKPVAGPETDKAADGAATES